MGIFGTRPRPDPYHPRQEPRVEGPLCAERVKEVFADCADFLSREVLLGGDGAKRVTMFAVIGMVRNERANDYVLKPLATDPLLRDAGLDEAFRRMADGAVYNLAVSVRTNLDQVVFDLIEGSLVFAFPDRSEMLSFLVPTEEKRAVSDPGNEPSVKGAKDSFVESLRTNTSLVRRRFRTPGLKIREEIVGRQSLTPVDLLYVDGLTNPDLVTRTVNRLREIDIDALLSTGNLEEYLADGTRSPFPLLSYTERPDRFCTGLAEGRVGVLADGIPLGYLLPGTLGQFLKTGEDRSQNWLTASCLLVLRYLCMGITLLLPALYVAAVTFHPEMIPARLARTIAEARIDVPFTALVEVLLLLLAFEIVQEAGLRLPASIGQTVSILGGLVVGTAAVEAKLISAAVLIAVAAAGIAGYTMPSQDLAGALRIWRFLLTVAGGLAGLFGVAAVGAALVIHLAGLESFGVPYLAPFTSVDGEPPEQRGILRQPVSQVKLREGFLRPENRRNQR